MGAPDQRAGGILTFVNAARGGASNQYGAFALGQVEGNAGSNYGFYSGGNLAGQKTLTFANTSSWGGFFEGVPRQSSCVPDYYNQKLNAAAPIAISSGNFPGGNGAYSATVSGGTPFSLNGGAVNLAPGAKITIFIKGNVYIGNNITFSASTADNTTKFALVVSGNIYIAPSVTRLDGLYIAQPATQNVAADDGALWTCHPNDNSNPLTSEYIMANCGTKLIVNGALVAKQVNFMRTPGDIGSAAGGENTPAGASASPNIAEVVNYTPEMVVGGPFFNSTTGPSLKIQSLVNLPPVF